MDIFARRFFFLSAIVIAVTAFIGFSRTYFLMQWTAAPRLPWPVHVHAVAATAWILFFVVQTALIDRNRPTLHRSLGLVGVAIAATFAISAFPAGFAMAAERSGTPEALVRLGLPFIVVPVFVVLFTAGLMNRRRPAVHKRLMLFATINALTPALGRLPVVRDYVPFGFVVIAALFVAAPFAYDWLSTRSIHPATTFAGLLVFLSVPGRIAFGASEFWQTLGATLLGQF